MISKQTDRRTFLKKTLTATAGAYPLLNNIIPAVHAAGTIPRRRLGKTNEMVSMIGLGGGNLGHIKDDAVAQNVLAAAFDVGINFFDTAWNYHSKDRKMKGQSELRYAKGLRGRRDKAFLMSKSKKRTKKESREQLEESLRRLNTDYLDLWQLHSIEKPEDVKQIFGPDGAMETALKARTEGKIRYIGITGHHDPYVHLEALEYHDLLDTMQFAMSCLDPHYLSFIELVLPKLVEYDIAALAMKTVARGRIPRHNVATVDECLRFAWSHPVSVLISGCDVPEHVRHNARQAVSFKPYTEEEMQALLQKTAPYAMRKDIEYFKKMPDEKKS